MIVNSKSSDRTPRNNPIQNTLLVKVDMQNFKSKRSRMESRVLVSINNKRDFFDIRDRLITSLVTIFDISYSMEICLSDPNEYPSPGFARLR